MKIFFWFLKKAFGWMGRFSGKGRSSQPPKDIYPMW